MTERDFVTKPDWQPYPGSRAGPEQLLGLAKQYHRAALELVANGPERQAPARLCAIHAVELYLSAFLLVSGEPTSKVRGLQHDLAGRATLARAKGLALRARTMAHLARMTTDREYLVWRYEPAPAGVGSPINRMTATLHELAVKVRRAVDADRPRSPGLAA